MTSFPPPTWTPPGHFYSPIVDPESKCVQNTLDAFETSDLPSGEDLAISDDLMRDTFRRISSHYHRLPFGDHKVENLRYFYDNPAFSYGDAVTYFGILLEFRPKRVIEVGSGYSSCLLMDVNDGFFDSSLDVQMIEPYPELLHGLIAGFDPGKAAILPAMLQDVPTETFQALQANDILFIDSSHVLKMASDVNDYLFRILPRLKPGVLIHIHDIFYPFEYGADWIRRENRSWNEAYAVRAFLQYNSAFEILYFNHYMYKKHTQLLEQIPLALRNCGGSFWLRKVK